MREMRIWPPDAAKCCKNAGKFFPDESQTLQPVRGEGYEPAYKSKANAETHPRLEAGGCRGVLKE